MKSRGDIAKTLLGGLLLVVTLAGQAAAQICVPPPAGLVSWWPGDENVTDIQDGNNGSLENGTGFAPGQVGPSFSFDGMDDKVLIGNPTNLQLQDFTIDAWIKLNTLDFDGFAKRIAGYSIGGYGFFLAGPSVVNPFGASAVRQLSLDKAGFDMVAAPFAVDDTDWHHVAVTKNGGTVIFYLDGVPGAAQRGGLPIASYNPGFVFNTNFTLGSLDNPDTQTLPGLLDEVEVFDRALAAEEILALFNAGSLGKCKPTTVVEVDIDIKPGSFPNSINPRSKGVTPVAILTTDTFDAGTVDPTTVLFGPTGTETVPVHAASEDVDGDGDADMILHFRTQATGIQCGDTAASLTGETFDEQTIQGSDSVNTVGCK